MKKALILLLLSLFILSSCKFSSEEESNAEKMAHPDIVLEKATYLLNQKDQKPITLYGDTITFYSKDNRAILEGFAFEQRDDDDDIYLEGSADRASVNTSTKILTLEGNVSMKKVSDDMEIQGENITFDSDNETVESNGMVRVKSSDGTFSGTDFFGDLKFSNYSFKTLDMGVLNSK